MVNILIVNNLLKEKKIIEVRILETFFKSQPRATEACLLNWKHYFNKVTNPQEKDHVIVLIYKNIFQTG